MAPRLVPHWLFPLAAAILAMMVVTDADAANGWGSKWQSNGNFPTGCALTSTTASGLADALVSCANSRSSTHEVRWAGHCTVPSNGQNFNTQIRTKPDGTWSACANHSGFVFFTWTCTGTQTREYDVNSSSGALAACAEPTPPPPTCTPATISGPGWYNMGTTPEDPPTAVCTEGCLAIFSGSSVTRRALVNGVYNYYAPGQYDRTSSTCATGEGLPTYAASVPADTCAAGQASGEVNGVRVCINQTTGETVNPNSPSTAPTGTTETITQTPATPPTEANPADTSGDGTTVIVNNNGTTTTTTTTTNPTTGVRSITTQVAPTTASDPVEAYCTKYPTAPICQELEEGGSSWGGSCASFSCEGDAIQCAIAREMHTRNCTLFDTATTLSDLGSAAVAGTDAGTSDNPALESNWDVVALPSVLDQTRFLSSTCPAPVAFSVMGNSMELSFTNICNVLEIIGLLGIAVSLVIAVRTVGVF